MLLLDENCFSGSPALTQCMYNCLVLPTGVKMKPGQQFEHWEQVRAGLLATIESFSEEELVYTPFAGSWPVGQIMLHIAECEDHWLHGVVRRELQLPVDYPLADHPSRAGIIAVLDLAHSRTLRFLSTLDEGDLDQLYQTRFGETFPLSWILWHVLEHEIHHRGELSLALGLLGRQGLDV
jgi:uncharacterized damage-inducible protein DinB